jgi:alkylation response protein AidB-like acyl-CoA dehydrogenase
MSETKKPHVSELEARAVAEGARETSWEAPSFVRELFLGKLDLSLIHPWPEPDAEEQQRAEKFLAVLERFLREQVDAERIERDARIPEATIQGLRDIGAFGIKIPREYGGLELSQYTYCRAMSLVSTVNSSLVALLCRAARRAPSRRSRSPSSKWAPIRRA